MRKLRSVLITVLGALTAVALPGTAEAQIGGCTPDLSEPIYLEIQTVLGAIPIALYPHLAPVTVQNFLHYANAGDFDGAIIHRSDPGFVIQGGGFREAGGTYEGIPTAPPIVNEPCLSNTRSTLAMARIANQVNSATNQWFVNLSDANVFLDGVDEGFTAFGHVLPPGMGVVDAIADLPIFDSLAYLELPVNQVLRELPLMALPVESPPGSYGCTRADPVFALLSEDLTDFVRDPTRSLPAPVVPIVPILLDPQCTGANAPGPASVACSPGSGRGVVEFDLALQAFLPALIGMGCDAVAESEAAWAARRAGTNPQLLAADVEILSVPEPRGLAGWVAGALLLLSLRRRHRSGRASSPADGSSEWEHPSSRAKA